MEEETRIRRARGNADWRMRLENTQPHLPTLCDPDSPFALQLNPTPLRPSGALCLHSFSSGISLNGSRNLGRTPDPTSLTSSSFPHPFLSIQSFHLELKCRDSSLLILSLSLFLFLYFISLFLPFSLTFILSSSRCLYKTENVSTRCI